jgi:hypothetical protein
MELPMNGYRCPPAAPDRAIASDWIARQKPPILSTMDDTPHRPEAPAEWLEALARSDAQRAAGQTVPAEAVHQRIRDTIARIEARQPKRRGRKLTTGLD